MKYDTEQKNRQEEEEKVLCSILHVSFVCRNQ